MTLREASGNEERGTSPATRTPPIDRSQPVLRRLLHEPFLRSFFVRAAITHFLVGVLIVGSFAPDSDDRLPLTLADMVAGLVTAALAHVAIRHGLRGVHWRRVVRICLGLGWANLLVGVGIQWRSLPTLGDLVLAIVASAIMSTPFSLAFAGAALVARRLMARLAPASKPGHLAQRRRGSEAAMSFAIAAHGALLAPVAPLAHRVLSLPDRAALVPFGVALVGWIASQALLGAAQAAWRRRSLSAIIAGRAESISVVSRAELFGDPSATPG